MRDFLNSDKGRMLGLALAIVGILALGWLMVGRMTGGTVEAAGNRVFIDAATGESFRHTLEVGEQMPIESPHSGERNGYEAEACYWTADGGVKADPTWVLPLDRVNPEAGPTFCPDCNRLVTQLNPQPAPGARPPPTRDEHEQRQAERPRRGQPPADASQRDPRDGGGADQ